MGQKKMSAFDFKEKNLNKEKFIHFIISSKIL
jgi:hypothetical protein